MCNFVPGQAIALGRLNVLSELGGDLPGELEIRPLISEVGEFDRNSDIAAFGTALLRTEPGLELYALSRLSARLARDLEKKEAAVDLNHYLPLGNLSATDEPSLRLSPYAEREVLAIRRLLRSGPRPPSPLRLAVLDSGLAPDYVPQRSSSYYDYTDSGRLTLGRARLDPRGHGTKVAKILDEILPADVHLSVGRLPADDDAITALTVAHALGDIVARSAPEVVNLSIAARSDVIRCPHCHQRIPAPSFLSSFFPLIIRVCSRTVAQTVTVLAAGNSGQVSNSRWLTDDVETLLFAVAENTRGERARYSGSPEGPHADLFSASAFGGDDPSEPQGQGVFMDGSYGTSFAAPFVSAVALMTKHFSAPPTLGYPTHLGMFTREVMARARRGEVLHFRPPSEP